MWECVRVFQLGYGSVQRLGSNTGLALQNLLEDRKMDRNLQKYQLKTSSLSRELTSNDEGIVSSEGPPC